MRTYLVDGTNLVRRGAYDPRFPEMDEARTQEFVVRIGSMAAPLSGRVRIELFFDGPRRPIAEVEPPVRLRFPMYGSADDAILSSARGILDKGKGVVVVTADGKLAEEAACEGARVMGLREFTDRLRERRA